MCYDQRGGQIRAHGQGRDKTAHAASRLGTQDWQLMKVRDVSYAFYKKRLFNKTITIIIYYVAYLYKLKKVDQDC